MLGFLRPRPAVVTSLPPTPVPDARATLREIAAEALIRQDEAEEVLRSIRARELLGVVARRGGPLVRRFFSLRDQLPPRCEDPDEDRLRSLLDAILHSHAMAVSVALDLAACEWRSERLAWQVERLDGLGEPARALEEVYAELTRSWAPPAAASRGAEELVV